MYKNLNTLALGVSGRQSELIELALTYGFQGLDIDIVQLVKQVDLHGLEHSIKFIQSANIHVGEFELPVRWQEDDSTFNDDLQQVTNLAEIASQVGAKRCRTVVMPASDEHPYHENFEFHRQRFTQIGDVLAKHDIQLGLDFEATTAHRDGCQNPFIHSPDALITLAKTVGKPNVGIVVDFWKWHVAGGSLELVRDVSADQIVVVRAADIATDVDLESISDEERLLPGATGVIDSAGVLDHLADIGYEGPVTPFAHGDQFKGQTRDAIIRAAGNSIKLPTKTQENEVGSEPVAEGAKA